MRRLLVPLFSIGLSSFIPSQAQTHCSHRADPKPFEGGQGPGEVHFSFQSDADEIAGTPKSWCYERVVQNLHKTSQLWVDWKDSLGTIMDFTMGPQMPHAVYYRNLEGDPRSVLSTIDYGQWEDVPKGPPKMTQAWRSPEEIPSSTRQNRQPLTSGFEVGMVDKELNGRIFPIKLEVRSLHDLETRKLTYSIANLRDSTPVSPEGRPPVSGSLTVDWPQLRLPAVQTSLVEQGVTSIQPGATVTAVMYDVQSVVVRAQPIQIRNGGRVLFTGTVVLHVPGPARVAQSK